MLPLLALSVEESSNLSLDTNTSSTFFRSLRSHYPCRSSFSNPSYFLLAPAFLRLAPGGLGTTWLKERSSSTAPSNTSVELIGSALDITKRWSYKEAGDTVKNRNILKNRQLAVLMSILTVETQTRLLNTSSATPPSSRSNKNCASKLSPSKTGSGAL